MAHLLSTFEHGDVNERSVSQYVGSFKGGNGVVVMTNTYNESLYEEIIYSVASTYKLKNYVPETRKAKIINLPDSVTERYTGMYKIDNDTLAIVKKKDGIYFEILADKTFWKMYFTDETNFFVLEDGMICNFEMDGLNKIIGLKIDKNTAKRIE